MHDHPPTGPADSRSSSSSAMWLVLGMCFFLFGGMLLLVIGAGFFWFMRVESAQSSVSFTTANSLANPYGETIYVEEIPDEAPPNTNALVLQIDDQGKYFMQGELLDEATLEERLDALLEENAETASLKILADSNCPPQVIDALKEFCAQKKLQVELSTIN